MFCECLISYSVNVSKRDIEMTRPDIDNIFVVDENQEVEVYEPNDEGGYDLYEWERD